MRIINRVEISKFRSIGEAQSIETYDLNILSGSNDSGKSNFLKALNLFFNGRTELDIRYNSENDFNKWFRDNNVRGQRVIEIKIHISKGNYGDKSGINNGFSAKKIYRSDGGYDTKYYALNGLEIDQEALSHRKANAVVNEKIRYVYIPTVRDIKFRESIQSLIQEIANSTDRRFKSQDLKDAFDKMETGIDSQLEDLTAYVKKNMHIDVETNVNFSTLLESLTFETSEKIKIRKRGKSGLETQKVSLRNRGEGIQMQFFSFMLWFISKNDRKHFYVWGYEEPEIAFEFKRQFELADLFQKTFSKVAQVFLTTHSPAFAFAEPNNKTKVFRINYELEKKLKSERYVSKVVPIGEYYEGLFSELTHASAENKKSLERDIWGINAQKISKMIGDSMDEIIGVREISSSQLNELKILIADQQSKNTQLAEKVESVETELNDLFPENIFICEDEKALMLWDNLLHEKVSIPRSNFKIISSKGCTNSSVETAVLHLMKNKPSYKPNIFRQLDRDGYTNEQVAFLEMAKLRNSEYEKFNKYKVCFLPVNEIENFAVLIDQFYTNDKLKEYEINNKISDAFRQTTISNIVSAYKLCKDVKERKIFDRKEASMIKEAREDMLKFFPGKEIKKTKRNFNAETFLMSKEFGDYPEEMQHFLETVKNHFAS